MHRMLPGHLASFHTRRWHAAKSHNSSNFGGAREKNWGKFSTLVGTWGGGGGRKEGSREVGDYGVERMIVSTAGTKTKPRRVKTETRRWPPTGNGEKSKRFGCGACTACRVRVCRDGDWTSRAGEFAEKGPSQVGSPSLLMPADQGLGLSPKKSQFSVRGKKAALEGSNFRGRTRSRPPFRACQRAKTYQKKALAAIATQLRGREIRLPRCRLLHRGVFLA